MNKYNSRIRKSISLLGEIGKKRILNIGCNEGWLEEYALSLDEKVKEIIALDISDYKIKINDKRFKFYKRSILDENLSDLGKFDVICFFEVLEHLPKGSERRVMKNIQKLLKKNGKIIFSTPYKSFFSCLLDPAFYFGHRHYSRRQVVNLFKRTGFEIENVQVRGGFFSLLGMLYHYFTKYFLRIRNSSMKMFAQERDDEYNSSKRGFVNIFVVARGK